MKNERAAQLRSLHFFFLWTSIRGKKSLLAALHTQFCIGVHHFLFAFASLRRVRVRARARPLLNNDWPAPDRNDELNFGYFFRFIIHRHTRITSSL